MIICKGLGVLILRHFAAGCFGMGLANNFCSGKIEDILNHLIFRQGCLWQKIRTEEVINASHSG